MKFVFGLAAIALAGCQSPAVMSAIPAAPPGNTPSIPEVVAASKPEEWRKLDPANTLYMDFPNGRVIIELAPQFAPNHVANIKALSREGFFVNGGVTRVQDNFVTQWAQAAEPLRAPKASKLMDPRETVVVADRYAAPVEPPAPASVADDHGVPYAPS